MTKPINKLQINNGLILDQNNDPVYLRGIALGGWLMIEGYMLAGPNIAEHIFKEKFIKKFGTKELLSFMDAWRKSFITESDIETIASWGCTCIRIPFNYRLICCEETFKIDEKGISFLDNVIKWCEKYSIYCILDMHAAPGSQNHDWHSDSNGKCELFENKEYWDKFLLLWDHLSKRYKDKDIIAGYDVLNEPVVPQNKEPIVKKLYEDVINIIRKNNDNHIIFIEGNQWSQRIEFLTEIKGKNICYSTHFYEPLHYTFNFIRELTYPGIVEGEKWDIKKIQDRTSDYYNSITKKKTPIYVGEFGINARGDHYGETNWVKDVLTVFDQNDYHWTYWTYKSMATHAFPDGIFRNLNNPPWVKREGPVYGMDNILDHWKTSKNEIIDSWKTKDFTLNKPLQRIISDFIKP
ncbi:MAG: glycoside hydrolase family 5 protein [Candidatus Omnitrophica bacterium]|nr:glycoside hydrolase family 5 protein [Candidatus Omnitrophota bacterium]